MDTRKVATEYRLAQWAQVVQTRLSRGQSIKAYCASEGISKNTYFYWQRKLREKACEIADRDTVTLVPSASGLVGRGASCTLPPGWTQLTTSDGQEISLTIEINGCHVTVTDEMDLELLAKVCRSLKSL